MEGLWFKITELKSFFFTEDSMTRGLRGRDRMVVGFTTTCAISVSPLELWVRVLLMARYTRYNIMWKSLSVPCNRSVVFSTNKIRVITKLPNSEPIKLTDDLTEILLKVALNTITLTPIFHKPVVSCLTFGFSVLPNIDSISLFGSTDWVWNCFSFCFC